METSDAIPASFAMHNITCNHLTNLDHGLRSWESILWGLCFRPEFAEQNLFLSFFVVFFFCLVLFCFVFWGGGVVFVFRFILRIWHPDRILSMLMDSSMKSHLREAFMTMNLLLGLRKMTKSSQTTAIYMYGMQTGDRDPCSQEQLVGPGSTTLI